MNPILLKLLGTVCIALAVFSWMARILAGGEFSILPWPIALFPFAIGLLILRHSRALARDEADRKDHA